MINFIFNSEIGIGLADDKFPSESVPGCEVNSYGYHGDDGEKYTGNLEGIPYGPSFVTGDTVGIGLSNHGDIYFTKNGLFLGNYH